MVHTFLCVLLGSDFFGGGRGNLCIVAGDTKSEDFYATLLTWDITSIHGMNTRDYVGMGFSKFY